MLCIMRTTISLNERLAKQVRREAEARGISMSAFIASILDDALKRREPSEQPPFNLVTVSGVKPVGGVDLDQPRALDAHEDQSRFGRANR
ncbi:MAG: ribbon-helix-helix protein, CopG family [Acidimicrobiaceae bacterium]|nr:ribbon-helix-helix protein, CopG family [Acidimicrobiaceae bacterium]MYC43573.1 ribbon-helix-helix protein, CopG family [Acidimicrobiaceae bacterium]